MRFSCSVPILRDRSHPDPYHQTFALAQLAEELGYEEVTVGHHHFLPGNMSDPLTFMAMVAARTSTLRVGTGIFQLPIHNPVRVAEQVATIDEISGGRISLGVGLGWWPLEYQVHGSNFRQRGARMEEALKILKLVWTEENVSYDGQFWSFPELTVYPRPIQQPHPILRVAGVADAAIDRAARLGDDWLCGPVQSLSRSKQILSIYRDACERYGTSPGWVLRRFAWVGSDQKQVEEEVMPQYVTGLLEHWRESTEDEEEKILMARIDGGEPIPYREIADSRLLWGDPENIIAQLQRYRDETGCDHVHAAFGSGLPGSSEKSTMGGYDDQVAMMSLFGKEVIPAFS